MNARHFVKMWAAVLLLSPALVFAQFQIDPGIRRQPALPDLVADVALGADCRIMVMVKNNGPGIVPDAGYSLSAPGSSGVQMYNDGNPWGGIVLGALLHAVLYASSCHWSGLPCGRMPYLWPDGQALTYLPLRRCSSPTGWRRRGAGDSRRSS